MVPTLNLAVSLYRSVSVGCGLPILIQRHDWPQAQRDRNSMLPDANLDGSADFSIDVHLMIERFRYKVSHTLGSLGPDSQSSRERLALYQLLHTTLEELEQNLNISGSRKFHALQNCKADLLMLTSPLAILSYYLSSARLHLQSFYLLDDPASIDFTDRIVQLYNTAYLHIKCSEQFGNSINKFSFEHCPFFGCQSYICAAFTVLKILKNEYFAKIIDEAAGTKLLESAILALRTMSVVNNDLPARLGEVIGFFCTVPDAKIIGGDKMEDIVLSEVKNRLSMSVVYDSLWIWRKQFQSSAQREEDSRSSNAQDKCDIGTITVALLTCVVVRGQSILDTAFGSFGYGSGSPADWTGFFDFDWQMY